MQPLDKTQILATQYKNWQDNLTATKTNHPAYNSSGGQFYYDIISNLIWLQKGLCAYSEFKLQAYVKCGAEFWINGVFPKFTFAGELDHYDPTLKTNQAWLWDNFFLIDSDVNSKKVKGSKQPKGLLKPDKEGFSPAYFLEYDISNHLFIPNKDREFDEQALIKHDLDTLGLNWQPTVERRATYLNDIIIDVKYGITTFEAAEQQLYQFFTAFKLCRNYISK